MCNRPPTVAFKAFHCLVDGQPASPSIYLQFKFPTTLARIVGTDSSHKRPIEEEVVFMVNDEGSGMLYEYPTETHNECQGKPPFIKPFEVSILSRNYRTYRRFTTFLVGQPHFTPRSSGKTINSRAQGHDKEVILGHMDLLLIADESSSTMLGSPCTTGEG